MKSAVSTVLMVIRVIPSDLDFPYFPPPELSLIAPESGCLDQLVVALTDYRRNVALLRLLYSHVEQSLQLMWSVVENFLCPPLGLGAWEELPLLSPRRSRTRSMSGFVYFDPMFVSLVVLGVNLL